MGHCGEPSLLDFWSNRISILRHDSSAAVAASPSVTLRRLQRLRLRTQGCLDPPAPNHSPRRQWNSACIMSPQPWTALLSKTLNKDPRKFGISVLDDSFTRQPKHFIGMFYKLSVSLYWTNGWWMDLRILQSVYLYVSIYHNVVANFTLCSCFFRMKTFSNKLVWMFWNFSPDIFEILLPRTLLQFCPFQRHSELTRTNYLDDLQCYNCSVYISHSLPVFWGKLISSNYFGTSSMC